MLSISHRAGLRVVQVWVTSFRDLETYDNAAAAVMDMGERKRERKYRLAADRRRFRLGRLFLRSVLAAYVDVSAQHLRFARAASGKPFLDWPDGICSPRFNLSHCRDFACLAVTDSCEVGVDVEEFRAMADRGAVARYAFSKREMEAVECAERPDVAFLQAWTRKEAIVKAAGVGLSAPLRALHVKYTHGPMTRWCGIDGEGRKREFRVFDIGDDSRAASLAVETRTAVRVDTMRFEPGMLIRNSLT